MTDLVWSADCAGCGRELAGPLCALCRLELLGPVGRREAAAPRLNPADGGPPLPVWSSAWYTGAVRRAVVAWKRTGRGELGREFSRAVARTAQAAAPLLGAICGQVAVVPAPSRWVRRWSRPGGGSEVLAAAVAGGLAGCGLSATVVDALVRAPLAREQAGRTSRQRQAGREGSTRVRRPQVVRPGAPGPRAQARARRAPAGPG
ncbi:MAG: hypothetical protein LBD90_04430, partial [Bifidobacteriaceae bacterium]|nr:hypothetical protein [Bifidobacteriaceae bacterium]